MPITYNNSNSPYDNNNINNIYSYSTPAASASENYNNIYGGVVDNTPPTLDDASEMEPPSYQRRSNIRTDSSYESNQKAASMSKQEPGGISINRLAASAEELPAAGQVAASTSVTLESGNAAASSGQQHRLSSPSVNKNNPGLRRQLRFWAPCLTGYPIITRDSFTRGKPHIGYYALILLVGLFMLGIFGMDLYFFIQYAVLNAFRPAADDPPFQWVAVGARARGFIAIGAYSHGVIAIGQFAIGGIAIGQLGIGVVTIAQCGIGLLFSVGMVSSSLVWASGMVSMAFYTRFTILAVAMWNSSATLFGLRSLYCFFEWRFLFKEDAEKHERFVASLSDPKFDYRGKPLVVINNTKQKS